MSHRKHTVRPRFVVAIAWTWGVLAAFAGASVRADPIDDRPGTRDRAPSVQRASGRTAGPDARAVPRLVEEAESAYRAQRWETALDAYKAVVALQPEYAHGWLRIGNLHQRRGQWLAAASAYRKSAEQAQRSPGEDHATRTKALLNLASVNLEMAEAALGQAGAGGEGEGGELRRRQAQLTDRLQAGFETATVTTSAASAETIPVTPSPPSAGTTNRNAGRTVVGVANSTSARATTVRDRTVPAERAALPTVEYLNPPNRP